MMRRRLEVLCAFAFLFGLIGFVLWAPTVTLNYTWDMTEDGVHPRAAGYFCYVDNTRQAFVRNKTCTITLHGGVHRIGVTAVDEQLHESPRVDLPVRVIVIGGRRVRP